MIAMIFEFWFDPDDHEGFNDYLAASEEVREHLAGFEGFQTVERFRSCTEPRKYVAVGFFDSEDAVRAWRTLPEHRRVQHLGRTRFFTDYRLRMAEVIRDYGPERRSQAPLDSRAVHG